MSIKVDQWVKCPCHGGPLGGMVLGIGWNGIGYWVEWYWLEHIGLGGVLGGLP